LLFEGSNEGAAAAPIGDEGQRAISSTGHELGRTCGLHERHLKAPKIVLRKYSIARASINSDIKTKRIITATLLKPR